MEDALKIATSKHDLMAIRIYDERDRVLPDVGILEVMDSETGRCEWIDTSSRRVRDYWQMSYDSRRKTMSNLLKHNRVDIAEVATDGDYVVELIKMFKQR